MYSNEFNEVDKILMFNRYVKGIEVDENPDVIIIGIPGGLMPFNKILTNKFGILAYFISQAVSPDFTVCSILYDDVITKYFDMLSTSLKYKYGFEVDCFNVASAQFDFVSSSEQEKLCFNFYDIHTVDKLINEKFHDLKIPVVNTLNSCDREKIVELLINKLSYYGNRDQLNMGGI